MRTHQRGPDERPHASAFVAGNDAQGIDERAAKRGRSATECSPLRPPTFNTCNARGERRDQGRTAR